MAVDHGGPQEFDRIARQVRILSKAAPQYQIEVVSRSEYEALDPPDPDTIYGVYED